MTRAIDDGKHTHGGRRTGAGRKRARYRLDAPHRSRHVLAYVLGNWRRHRKDFANGRLLPAILDPYSSAISFDGWTKRFRVPPGHTPLPVSSPRTELMRRGWCYKGPLDPYAAPGPLW